jgi:hypothetical protein
MTTPRHHSATRSLLATVAVAIPAMLIGSGLSAPPAQASYMVTIEQEGSNVVATGSGSIDLTDLTSAGMTGPVETSISPSEGILLIGNSPADNDDIYTGITPSSASFGTGGLNLASAATGNFVGICGVPMSSDCDYLHAIVILPTDYTSGAPLGTSTATFDDTTLSGLGVTPGTYEWTWGSGADADSFTLQIGPAAAPAPLIGRGLPALLAVGGLLLGSKLLGRGNRRRFQLG